MSQVDTAQAALQRLASTDPKDFIRRHSSGQRWLAVLFSQCRAAGLTSVVPEGDVDRLHALFDVALESGLGSLVYDYVLEVCSDKYFTSSDALEAYLLDGECVKQWCSKMLQRCQTSIQQGLAQGLSKLGSSGGLQREAGRLAGLVLVLQALAAPADEQGGQRSTPPSPNQQQGARPEENVDLEEAKLLQQCLQVLEWTARQGLQPEASRSGRYLSEQEWRGAVNKRRDAAAPATLFLHDMLASLRDEHGVPQLQYPPASLERLVAALFLAGGTGQAARRAKLALYLYTLLDAAHPISVDAFREGFQLPVVDVQQWRAQQLLDEASGGQQAAPAFEQACRMLPGIAHPELPFKVAEVLAARGRHDVALAVLRGRGTPAGLEPALQEAEAAMRIRLGCGLFTEAYLEAQRHCTTTAPELRPAATRALVRQLADWAHEHRALSMVLELPLMGPEEHVLVAWLEERMEAGDRAAQLLPMFYLLRGRIPEALHANARLAQSSAAEGMEVEEDEGGDAAERRAVLADQRRLLLEAAAGALPQPQRALVVGAPANRPGEAPAIGMLSGAAQTDAAEQENIVPEGLHLLTGLTLRPDPGYPALYVRPHGQQPPPLLYGNLAAGPADSRGSSAEEMGKEGRDGSKAVGGRGSNMAPSVLLSRPASAAASPGVQQAAAGAVRFAPRAAPTADHAAARPAFGSHLQRPAAEGSGAAAAAAISQQDDWNSALGIPGSKPAARRSGKRARIAPSRVTR